MDLFPDERERAQREALQRLREREAAERRLREREADFTGRGVVRASLAAGWFKHLHTTDGNSHFEIGGERVVCLDAPLRVLDIGAGGGAWGSEARRRAAIEGWPIHITAVEIEPAERSWLERHADKVIIGDWREAFGLVQDSDSYWRYRNEIINYDLVIGNPPFSQARAPVRPVWEIANATERRRMIEQQQLALVNAGWPDDADTEKLAIAQAQYNADGSMVAVALAHARAVALYMSQQSWTKTASGWITRWYYPPVMAFDIPGSVSHREGGGGDSVPYSLSVWRRGHTGPTVTSMVSPFADRSWKVRPGTEPDSWCDQQQIPLLVRGVGSEGWRP